MHRRVPPRRVRISVELSREDAGIVMEALEVAKAELAQFQLGGQRTDVPSLAADALLLMARRTLSGCFRGRAKARDIWFLPDTNGCIHDDATPEQSGPAHLVMVHVEESVLHGEGGTSDLPTPAVRRMLCDGFELVGRSPRQSTALPSENGPTLMSALGAVNGIALRQDAR